MAAPEIETLIQLFAKLPGLGPRSARRAALHLVKKKDSTITPLVNALKRVEENLCVCATCGNIDSQNPCAICSDHKRDKSQICVVQDVADLWALERAHIFKGHYHILGGTLSALDGIGPQDLRIDHLIERAKSNEVHEIILATSATVDGQTTAYYIVDSLQDVDVSVSGLAQGIPMGGELDFLDDGTITAALGARKQLK